MELIPPGTKVDFLKYSKACAVFSLALIATGVVTLIARGGPNLGIDFAGGSLVQVRFRDAVATGKVRAALSDVTSNPGAIQEIGGAAKEFLIRMPLEPGEVAKLNDRITAGLADAFGKDAFEVMRVEAVGPRVGQVLREKAVLAVFAATVMMGLYIWWRFEWRFGVGAAMALLHDVLVALAGLIVWNYEFDLTTVAALLTVIGYSVNDTVIVSDRIRENMRKDRRSTLLAIVNRSINETLSRTVLTAGTSVLVVLALYLLGGNVIHGFAFTLLIGFIIGTYSSIYIASPLVLLFERWRPTPGRRAAK